MFKYVRLAVAVVFSLGMLSATPVWAASPQDLLNTMYDRLSKAKTVEFSGVLRTMHAGTTTPSKDFTFSGKSDISDINHTSVYFHTELEESFLNTDQVVVDGVIMDNKTYFKANFVTPQATIDNLDVSPFNNVWILIDKDEIRKSIFKEDYDTLKNTLFATENVQLTAKQKVEALRLFKKNRIFIATRLADAKIDTIPAYHLRLRWNKAGERQMELDWHKLTTKKAMTKTEVQELDRRIKEAPAPEAEVWIDKKTMLPLQVRFVYTEKKLFAEPDKNEIVLRLKKFNSPVKVWPPAVYQKIEDVLSQVMVQLMARMASSTAGSLVNTTSSLQ